MMNLNVRCKKFSALCLALALVVVLLSGCGGTAQTGTPADGPVRVGQTVTVGGCQIKLRGYVPMEQLTEGTFGGAMDPNRKNADIAIVGYIYNTAVESTQIADDTLDNFFSWVLQVRNQPEEEYQKSLKEKINTIPATMRRATVECAGEKLLCQTIGADMMLGQGMQVLQGKAIGVVLIHCNVPKGWNNLEITYTLNGETVTFELSAIDLVA